MFSKSWFGFDHEILGGVDSYLRIISSEGVVGEQHVEALFNA